MYFRALDVFRVVEFWGLWHLESLGLNVLESGLQRLQGLGPGVPC